MCRESLFPTQKTTMNNSLVVFCGCEGMKLWLSAVYLGRQGDAPSNLCHVVE